MNLTRSSTRIAKSAILVLAFTLGVVTVGTTEAAPTAPKQAVVAVKGLACPICAHRLRKVLSALPGATKAEVNLKQAEAIIDFAAESNVGDEQIRRTIKDAGFVPGKIEWRTAAKDPNTTHEQRDRSN